MRAVVLADARPALEEADVAEPVPAPNEVVLSVTACGICGSDLHVAAVLGDPGTVLGHEIAGVVRALGADVDPSRWRLGQPVAARPLIGCRACQHCRADRPDRCDRFQLIGLNRPGGFAEQVAVSGDELFALPTALTGPDQALVEPLAVARRAMRRTQLRAGETVAVIGCGPVGLAAIAWARTLGAGAIVASDPSPSRRDLALLLGAHAAVDPAELDLGAATLEFTGHLPSAVIECSGRPEQIGQAMDHVAVEGRVTVLSVCISEATIVPWTGLSKELDVRFSLYYGTEDFVDTIAALEDGSLQAGSMVTETIGLPELPERFARLSREPDGGKVVVVP